MDDQYASAFETYENTPEIEIQYAPIDYQNETKKLAEAAAAAQLDKSNRAAFDLILSHYDLSETEANLRVLTDWCGAGQELTIEKFQAFLEAGQGADLDWKGTRERILQEIAALLEAKGDRHTYDNARAIAAMRYQTKAALRAKLAELKFRANKTANDARNLLAEHREAERRSNPFHPYEEMPSNITRATIQAATVPQIKYLNQRFGHEQVKARLNTR